MPKYIKIQSSVYFKDLLNDTETKKKYAECLSFTLGYPYTFFMWLINGSEIVFFKRPQTIIENPIVKKVVIDFSSHKAAKIIATRYVNRKLLNKIFNFNTKSVII